MPQVQGGYTHTACSDHLTTTGRRSHTSKHFVLSHDARQCLTKLCPEPVRSRKKKAYSPVFCSSFNEETPSTSDKTAASAASSLISSAAATACSHFLILFLVLFVVLKGSRSRFLLFCSAIQRHCKVILIQSPQAYFRC